MKLKVVENVYTEGVSARKFKRALKLLVIKKPTLPFYLVTEPLSEVGSMEIYNFNELLQPYYRKQKKVLRIFGIANTKTNAQNIVVNILNDQLKATGSANLRDYVNSNK